MQKSNAVEFLLLLAEQSTATSSAIGLYFVFKINEEMPKEPIKEKSDNPAKGSIQAHLFTCGPFKWILDFKTIYNQLGEEPFLQTIQLPPIAKEVRLGVVPNKFASKPR